MRKDLRWTVQLILMSLLVITGCSKHADGFRLSHPGEVELIDLGEVDKSPHSYHAYKIQNKIIYAHPDAVHPSIFSLHLLEHTEVYDGESVLDIGTGTGIQALFAADNASHVLATDIVESALENTLYNARQHGVEDKISVRKSDLFNALKPDEKFDVIISAIPFAWNASNQDNWALQERFFRDVSTHMKPNGRIYFSTGYLFNLPRTKNLAEQNGLKIIRVDMDYARVQDIEPIVYVFKQEKYAKWLAKDLAKEE